MLRDLIKLKKYTKYSELDERTKNYNIETIRNIPNLISSLVLLSRNKGGV